MLNFLVLPNFRTLHGRKAVLRFAAAHSVDTERLSRPSSLCSLADKIAALRVSVHVVSVAIAGRLILQHVLRPQASPMH